MLTSNETIESPVTSTLLIACLDLKIDHTQNIFPRIESAEKPKHHM